MNEEEIKIPTQNKNLFNSPEAMIQKQIDFIQKNNEIVIGISLNENTKNKLEKEGIFGFRNYFLENIPVLINNYLLDNVIEIHKQKCIKSTPYEEYKVKE